MLLYILVVQWLPEGSNGYLKVGPLSHKQKDLIHEFDVSVGCDLKSWIINIYP